MKIEGYMLVVNEVVFEDGEINLGRGSTKHDVPMIKLYKEWEDAVTDKRSVWENTDIPNEDILIYKVSFELPDPQPTEVTAEVERIEEA